MLAFMLSSNGFFLPLRRCMFVILDINSELSTQMKRWMTEPTAENEYLAEIDKRNERKKRAVRVSLSLSEAVGPDETCILQSFISYGSHICRYFVIPFFRNVCHHLWYFPWMGSEHHMESSVPVTNGWSEAQFYSFTFRPRFLPPLSIQPLGPLRFTCSSTLPFSDPRSHDYQMAYGFRARLGECALDSFGGDGGGTHADRI